MSRIHFVPSINDGQAGIETRLEDRVYVRAVQAE
jgi:hypothetical protein